MACSKEALSAEKAAANVPANRIDPGHLRFVVKALHEFGHNWERLGEDLNVSKIKKIALDYKDRVSLCLIVMVDCLLRGRLIKNPGRPANWKQIVRVIHRTNSTHAHLLAGKLSEFQTFSPCELAETVDATPLIVNEYPTVADIREVVSQLHSLLVPAVAGRWFEIGALLGLPLNSLTIIRSDSTLPDPRDKLRKVLYEWLTFAEEWELETPCWQVLVDVVAHGAGGDEPGLAWEIADKHRKPGYVDSAPSTPTATTTTQNPFEVLLTPSASPQKPVTPQPTTEAMVPPSKPIVPPSNAIVARSSTNVPPSNTGAMLPRSNAEVKVPPSNAEVKVPPPNATVPPPNATVPPTNATVPPPNAEAKVPPPNAETVVSLPNAEAREPTPSPSVPRVPSANRLEAGSSPSQPGVSEMNSAEQITMKFFESLSPLEAGASPSQPGVSELNSAEQMTMKSEDLDENLSPLEAGASPSQPGVSELNSAEQITVRSEHVEVLAEMLSPMAHNWDAFMWDLGVPDSKTKQIRANNISLRPESKNCLTTGLKALSTSSTGMTYGCIAAVLEGKAFRNEQLAESILQSNKGTEVVKEHEVDVLVEQYLYTIAESWEVLLNQLNLPPSEFPCSGNFTKKCLCDGLNSLMSKDEPPSFAKIMEALNSGTCNDLTLATKLEDYFEKCMKDQQAGGSVKSDQEGAIFMQPTPGEESEEPQPSAVLNDKQEEPKSKQPLSPGDLDEDVEYDSSGDEADRVTDDGWPWTGEKTHYPPYKRNSNKTSEITLQEQDGKLTTIKHTKRPYTRQGKPEDFYPMNPAKLPHGIALIISNKKFTDSIHHREREGTEKDVRNLRKTFRYLGYEVLIRRDCTSVEMEGFFKPGGLVFQKAKKEHDSFVCCILSHGSSDKVIGADSEPVNIGQKNGVQYEVAHCDSLKKKPKLFFIQACRGSGTDGGIECDSGTENRIQSDFSVVPTKSDYFISYATVQGQKSTRHMDHGSRYVLELCRALVSDGHNSTLSSMQKAVNKSVGGYDAVTCQQPLAEDSLTSSVYFFEDQLKETAV